MSKFGIYEVLDVIFYDWMTGKPAFKFDTLKVSNVQYNVEKAIYNGGLNNAELLVLNHSPKATLNISDALFSDESWKMLSGNRATDSKVIRLYLNEVVAPIFDTNIQQFKIELPQENSAIENVQIERDNQLLNLTVSNQQFVNLYNNDFNKLRLGGTVSSTYLSQFRYGGIETYVDENVILNTTLTSLRLGGSNHTYYNIGTLEPNVWWINDPEGIIHTQDLLTIYYELLRETNDYIAFSPYYFPGYYKIVGYTLTQEMCSAELMPIQMVIPKAKLSGEWKIELRSDMQPAVLDFNLNIVLDIGKEEDLIQWIPYE